MIGNKLDQNLHQLEEDDMPQYEDETKEESEAEPIPKEQMLLELEAVFDKGYMEKVLSCIPEISLDTLDQDQQTYVLLIEFFGNDMIEANTHISYWRKYESRSRLYQKAKYLKRLRRNS